MRIPCLVALVLLPLNVMAQLSEVGQEAFNSDAIVLDFDGPFGYLPPVGSEIGDLFWAWGVTFEGVGDSRPIRSTAILDLPVLPPMVGVLSNGPNSTDSAGRPLIINFYHPVAKVGMTLGNGGPGVNARLEAFDSTGRSVGVVEKEEVPTAMGLFLGVETEYSEGMSKVTVDYGASEFPEQIGGLMFARQEREELVQYLPQIGDGAIPGGGAFQTEITVVNLANTTASGEVAFLNDSGHALFVGVQGRGLVSRLSFSLSPFESWTERTDGTRVPAAGGYARVDSNAPVLSAAVFRVFDDEGSLSSELGVGGSSAGNLLAGSVIKTIPSGVVFPIPDIEMTNSGVALVNTADDQATVILTATGPGDTKLVVETEIPPFGHKAQFLDELFPDLDGESFDGTLVITSVSPIAAIILRTVKGVARGSLPLGTTQKP